MAFEDLNSLPQNNPSLSSTIDQSYISQITPKGYEESLINAYNKSMQPEQIGAQGQASLYPGMGENINVGKYSGSIVGDNPIFVPTGNILALDPMLERKKALDMAARKRAAEIKPWERPKAPEFKDPYWNKQLYNVVEGGLNQVWQDAIKEYGPANARIVLQDPNTSYGQRVAKIMNNAEYLTKNVNEITDLVATIDKGLQEKTIYLNPEKKKLYEAYKQKLSNFEDINTLQGSNLPELTRQLMGVRDLNDYLNTSKVMDKLEAEIKTTFGVSESDDYFKVVETQKKSWKPIIDKLSKELAETTFAGEYTAEEIAQNLGARLQDQVTKQGSIQQKTEATRGAEEVGDVQDPNAEGVFTTYTTSNKTLYGNNVIASYNMSYSGEPKELVVIDEDGTPKKVSIRALDMTNIKVVQPDKKTKFIYGITRVQLGKVEKLEDGRIVQNAKVYKPKTIKDEKTGRTTQTWEVSEELIEIKTKSGEGTNMYTQIKTQMKNPKMKKNYEKGVKKLTQTKPSKKNNVQYTEAQEKNIEATMKANPGYTREEVINALGY